MSDVGVAKSISTTSADQFSGTSLILVKPWMKNL